jgi:rhodanese-related sulfurtransferase
MSLEAMIDASTPNPGGFYDIDVVDAWHHRAHARVIDVREHDEFVGPLGHVPGAELVPLGAISAVALPWWREAPVMLVCRSGGRSARAASALARMGFRHVFNVRGGMTAWSERGLPAEGAAGGGQAGVSAR